ncbi:MAG TPA: decarboxylating 6-phosphogluconate dehydrogenase, partial [Gemmatimonadaceae bacterium]|nr:decarboxylating 6-phosphogluconate dehydrogenase [Gemmatimonadaceae bacterium]
MQLAMIGLGKMGGAMTERLIRGGHSVVTYDRSPDAVQHTVTLGATASSGIADLTSKLSAPRVVWVMVPAGKPTDDTINELAQHLERGDVIIDGGNSNFHDTMRRNAELSQKGIEFVDAGTSGGVWGLKEGYCEMVGASDATFKLCEPLFKTLAPPNGYAHVGPTGAGHYVKMVHNGIEYGMLQAYAEGYEILHASSEFKLDLAQISALWNQGSVVRSWLNELAAQAFARDGDLTDLKGYVEDSGEGRWTVQ